MTGIAALLAPGAGAGPDHLTLVAIEAALAPAPVQRVADQHQSEGREPFGDRHGAHAPTEGASAEDQALRGQAGPSGQRRRPVDHRLDQHRRLVGAATTLAAVGEVHAIHGDAVGSQRLLDCDEGRLVPIRPRPRREQQGALAGHVAGRAVMSGVCGGPR